MTDRYDSEWTVLVLFQAYPNAVHNGRISVTFHCSQGLHSQTIVLVDGLSMAATKLLAPCMLS